MTDNTQTVREDVDHAPAAEADHSGQPAEADAERGEHGGGRGRFSRYARAIARAGKRVGWPKARNGRVLISACLAIALLLTGGFFWLHSGRAAFGTYAGEGALSFVPAWLPEDVAFRYGDRLVTKDELNQHSDMLRVLYGVTTPKKDNGKAQFRKDVAKSYAVSLVLQRAASERDISIADKQARDALTRFVSERIGEGPGAYNQFIQSLSDEGTSEKVVLGELKRRLAIAKLSNAVVGDVGKVTDKEVKQAFAKRKDSLGTPERRAISNIVVKSKDEAHRVLREIRSGTPFAKVARTVSLDGSTRDKGGRLGTLSKGQLEKSYAEVAFSTNKGELFGPVKNKHGWNVGRINKIVPPEPAEFSEIKTSLAQQLRTEAALERWRSWLGERIADAGIVYADQYRPADPDALPTVAPSRLSGPR